MSVRSSQGGFVAGVGLVFVLGIASAVGAQTTIVLSNEFIRNYMDRGTITVNFTVDKAHPHPNPAATDGDLHAAGRAPQIGLATVAEIMNAAHEPQAVAAIHAAEQNHHPIPVSGVWRLWCEHAGEDQQVQGAALGPFGTTNPPHVFEIHPITHILGHSIMDWFRPIDGFDPKDPRAAFAAYEHRQCVITPGPTTTTITTKVLGYNYVEFGMKPVEAMQTIHDGYVQPAAIFDRQGNQLLPKRRVIIIRGSPPEEAFLKMTPASPPLHVLGIPRICLASVAWRCANATSHPNLLNSQLPYEIVIVGAY